MEERDERGSPSRFGHEWSTYSRILPESQHQLERWLGSTGLASCAGKSILDVGCGMGRNPYWMLQAGARQVTGVDLDAGSLAAARANLQPFPQARVERCSAYDLSPERIGAFDRVTCIGVLHHLQDPRQALQAMWGCVRPGGDLVLWCYAREGNELLLPAILTCQWIGSRLPIRLTHLLARALSLVLYPAFRLLPFRVEYYRRLRTLSYRNLESIVFDQMLPHIANYWTRSDMEALLQPLGGEVHLEHVQGNSWHARVRKA